METKHTPTPWKYVGHNWHEGSIYAANGEKVCGLDTEDWQVTEDNQDELEAEQEEVAAFIVKAVNCHDELLEALTAFVSDMGPVLEANSHFMGASTPEWLAKARAAIAKAKGEPA